MCYRWLLCIIVTVIALVGCQHLTGPADSSPEFVGDVAATAKPWTDIDIQNDSNNFQFAVISDLHGSYRPGIFEQAVRKIGLMQPEFVISVGDLIEGYTDDEAIIDYQHAEFEQLISPLRMRFFYVPGNHDLSSKVMTQKWEERYGSTYYSFIYRNVLFICLNTEDPLPTQISKQQVEYVRKALSENTGVRWTFVFMHKPLWLRENLEWETIESTLAERPHTVFAGHHHNYVKYNRRGHSYIKLGTTGGVSQMRGSHLGEFDHITWITMTDDKPIIANLNLDGILADDIVTESKSEMIEHLFSGKWLTSDSVALREPELNKAVTFFHLINPSSVPLKVHGSFRSYDNLMLSIEELDLTIQPSGKVSIPLEITANPPMTLSHMKPLIFEGTAVYKTPGERPISSKSFHQVDIHSTWQGPELLRNGHFSHGMTGWLTALKTPDSGTFSVESDMLKAKVSIEDELYSLLLINLMSVIKTDVDYQLSFKAKNQKGLNQIRFVVRDGGTNAQLLIDGKETSAQVFNLAESMSPYILNFRFAKTTAIKGGMLMWSFRSKGEVTLDDISLRAVNRDLKSRKEEKLRDIR